MPSLEPFSLFPLMFPAIEYEMWPNSFDAQKEKWTNLVSVASIGS